MPNCENCAHGARIVAEMGAELARLRSVLEWVFMRGDRLHGFDLRLEMLRRGLLTENYELAWSALATAAPAQPSAQQEEEAPQ